MSIVGQYKSEESVKPIFFTFEDLLNLCESYPEHIFKFEGTDYTPKSIQSWRGRYDLASMDYDTEDRYGKEIAKIIKEGLGKIHTAWKGGEYQYYLDDEFYISIFGRCEEHKIYDYKVYDNFVELITDYAEY